MSGPEELHRITLLDTLADGADGFVDDALQTALRELDSAAQYIAAVHQNVAGAADESGSYSAFQRQLITTSFRQAYDRYLEISADTYQDAAQKYQNLSRDAGGKREVLTRFLSVTHQLTNELLNANIRASRNKPVATEDFESLDGELRELMKELMPAGVVDHQLGGTIFQVLNDAKTKVLEAAEARPGEEEDERFKSEPGVRAAAPYDTVDLCPHFIGIAQTMAQLANKIDSLPEGYLQTVGSYAKAYHDVAEGIARNRERLSVMASVYGLSA
ncbi:hypothetical protein [Lentzea sp. E54]|uniref:hypothetical protein n=1 Tax=Lentzea xerophila TaxID=3435883 RepID=UPI003DA6633D